MRKLIINNSKDYWKIIELYNLFPGQNSIIVGMYKLYKQKILLKGIQEDCERVKKEYDFN